MRALQFLLVIWCCFSVNGFVYAETTPSSAPNPMSQRSRRWWLTGGPLSGASPQPTATPEPEITPSPLVTPEPVISALPQPKPTPYQPGTFKLPAQIPKQAWLKISKKNQRLELIDQHRVIVSIPVSTGRGAKDTPEGTFRILSRVPYPSYYGSPHLGRRSWPSRHPNNPLGSHWMQLNVGHYKTRVAIGLHGTDQPHLIGKPVSGGCVRMHNQDVALLFQILRVGMKVIIRAD